MPVTSFEDIQDRKLYGVSFIFADNHMAEEVCRDVNKKYPALEAFQNKDSLDIVKRGCSKGQGILFVKEYLQIEMMAGIGDSFNDMPMLQAAYPSFTFLDSPKMLRNNVTYIVGSVAESLELLNSKNKFL